MGGKLKALFAQTDMTVGKPWKQIVIFTIPMLIGNIAQQLYNTVDSIVVGKYVGDNALAAVGSASPILNLLLVLYWYIDGNQHHGVPVFWSKGQRKLIEDHREHDHSYRGVLADHYGPRFGDDPAAFKDAEHAGQYY